MGETSLYCHPSPEACCLELHETILILVALIILVQLALKLATVICYYVWYLLGSLFEMIFAKAPQQAKATSAAPRPKRVQCRRPSEQSFQQEAPRYRRRSESSSPCRRCLHCTLEPLRVTLDLQRDEPCPYYEHTYSARHTPPKQTRYHNCECDCRPRPRPSSAPSSYRVTRYRDVGCGSSDPMLKTSGSATDHRTTPLGAPGSDPFPRTQVTETLYRSMGPSQDADYSMATTGLSRSRRPAKVYIYPVHPQTPPGSRSASPERSHRRRGAVLPTQEELQDYEPREQRRKMQDTELGLSGPLSRFHNLTVGPVQGGTPLPEAKQRLFWPEPLSSTPAHSMGASGGQGRTPLPDAKQRHYWPEPLTSTPVHSLAGTAGQVGTPMTETKQRHYWTEPLTSTPTHSMATSPGQGGTPMTETKQRHYWTEPITSSPAQDWVYRPLK